MLNLAIEPLERRESSDEVELGEVFTRRWVAELILDLAGYTADQDLWTRRVIEPACGEGAFLGPIIDRLLRSAERNGVASQNLANAVTAFDLSELNVERARKFAVGRLVDSGVMLAAAEDLARRWIRHGDFLLEEDVDDADFVVGNPPYIRLEDVPAERTAAYRDACPSMRGRSDVYIGFIERALRLLRQGGAMGFIVPDRWMHNQYGAALRRLVANGYAVETVIEMHDVDAFEDDVSAYPAITIIRNSEQSDALVVAANSRFDSVAATRLMKWAGERRSRSVARVGYRAARLKSWFDGEGLWPSGDPRELVLLRQLEQRFPSLEDPATQTRIGIGVATGRDSVFVTHDAGVAERDRLLPLVTSKDVATGAIEWSGTYLVNPWQEGDVVNLKDFPRLSEYLHIHEDELRRRHVAQRRPDTWFRTIDRVAPQLLQTPKLLLPDIKAASHPVLDEGHYYPHHNLYFVTSRTWDLEVLGGLLLSDIANLFVGAYSVKMRGGCYRFQSQYVRKIRVPHPASISKTHARGLRIAFGNRDVEHATAIASKVYGIDSLAGRA